MRTGLQHEPLGARLSRCTARRADRSGCIRCACTNGRKLQIEILGHLWRVVMSTAGARFSIRDFLRSRKALLVHFSGPTTRHTDLVFPDDLRKAMTLGNIGLAFSTILVGDNENNATGSVGIVVDITENECVSGVSPSDAGSYLDPAENQLISGGCRPTKETCARSIDKRTTYNEWIVRNYTVIGIFVFFPTVVPKYCVVLNHPHRALVSITVDDVACSFSDQRIFSASGDGFFEYDRKAKNWCKVSYDNILSDS